MLFCDIILLYLYEKGVQNAKQSVFNINKIQNNNKHTSWKLGLRQ